MAAIYEVRATHDGKVSSFGVRLTLVEAQALLEESRARVEAVRGRNDHYWIETIDTTGLFELPSKPTPRDRYTTRVTRTSPEGVWTTVHVDVLDGDRVVAGYDRNHSMFGTFEPFRQDDGEFALISPHYTATSVLDLTTGEIVAGEEPDPDGFCPVGFYVPDWWDIHDGSIPPARSTGPTTRNGPAATSGSSGAACGATTSPGRSSTSTCRAYSRANSCATSALATSSWPHTRS